MARKKKAQYSDYFASSEPNDRFGTIFESMCVNERFKKLSPVLKWFYVLCRVESRTVEGAACLYKHAQKEGTKYTCNCFVFPAKHQEKYGIDRRHGTKYFKALIDAGFIEIEENNYHRRNVNVYRFSAKWKDSS